jgi:hypothetical protein
MDTLWSEEQARGVSWGLGYLAEVYIPEVILRQTYSDYLRLGYVAANT